MIPPLDPCLQDLLRPQERFEELRRRFALQAGKHLCDFAYANPYDGPDPEVAEALREAIDSDRSLDLQYTPYGGSTITRRLVADALSRSHGERFRWRDVVLTPGAMAALNVALFGLRGDGGGEVVMPVPCWLDYPLYLTWQGLRPVPVPLREGDFRLDLEALAAAIGPRTRGVLLTQPGNPTGVLHGEDELRGLAALLEAASAGREHPLLLVSDECHRDVVYGDARFLSPMAFYDATCLVYSFGKSLFMQGQRAGYVAVSPRAAGREEAAETLERTCRTLGYCTPTALMQIALRRLLRHRPSLDRIAERRARVIGSLREFGYRVVPSDATFFLYVAAPGGDGFAFAERLARRGVLVLPAETFHHGGYFRISLTADDEMVERAMPVFAEEAP